VTGWWMGRVIGAANEPEETPKTVPERSRPRLRAWQMIPPNHPAGAATGCLSIPGVCPAARPLVKAGR
jgi:hypothetical protein